MEDCREKKEEDCRKEWRIVSKRGGLLDRVEDCTLEARSAGGPLVTIIILQRLQVWIPFHNGLKTCIMRHYRKLQPLAIVTTME